MRKSVFLVVMMLVLGVISGCQAVQPTVEEAQQQVGEAESALCTSIDTYEASLAALEAVNADTTVAELEDLNKAADDAYVAMLEAVGDLQSAELQAVESAVDAFQQSLRDISPESTLGEVSAQVRESAATVRASVAQLDQTAECGQ